MSPKQDNQETGRAARRPATVTLCCGSSVSTHEGRLGSVGALVVDEQKCAITHLIVTNSDAAGTGRLVPVGCATAGDGEQLMLDLDRAEVLDFDRLTVPYYLADPPSPDQRGDVESWLNPPVGFTFALHDQLPRGTVALRRPVVVHTRDDQVLGIVDLWDLEPRTGRIQTILVRRGWLLNHRGLSVSGPLIDHIDDDGIHLVTRRAQLFGS
ncbi:MAG: hypothetical protein ABI658_26985 [Acidimicrobiales bacterium]